MRQVHWGIRVVGAVALAFAATACGSDSASDGDDTAGVAAPDTEGGETSVPTEEPEAEVDDVDLEEAFSGDIEIVVPYGPGGGYDLIARVVQEHLPNFLPGDQNIIVQNVEGAEEVNGARQVTSAPADGTTLLHYSAGQDYYKSFLGADFPGVDFTQDLQVVGRVHNDPLDMPFTCLRSDVATTLEDAFEVAEQRGSDITLGHQVPTLDGQFVNSLDGVPFSVVLGYDGGAEVYLAVESGEMDGTSFCHIPSMKQRAQEWYTEDLVSPVALHYPMNDEMRGWFDEVGWEVPPLLSEALPELADISETERQVFEVDQFLEPVNRYHFGVHADTPEPLQQALTDALEEMTEDSEFQDAMAEINRPAGWVPPSEFYDSMEELTSFPEDVHDIVRSFLLRD